MSDPMPTSTAHDSVTAAVPPAPAALLPERIGRLADISQNLWWSWQLDARELLHRLDHRLWEETRHTAVQFLTLVAPERLEKRAQDPVFLERYDQVVRRFDELASSRDTWVGTHYHQR